MADEFCLKMPDFYVTFRDLLHAANLRHGTNGFTSLPKEGVLRIFFALKKSDGFSQVWKASTLPLDHRSRYTTIGIAASKFADRKLSLISITVRFIKLSAKNFPTLCRGSFSKTEFPQRSSKSHNVNEQTDERVICGKSIYRPDSVIYAAEIARVFIRITANITPLDRQWKLLTFMLLCSQLVTGSSTSLVQAFLVTPSVAVSADVAVVLAKRSETLGVVAVTTQRTVRAPMLPASKAYQ